MAVPLSIALATTLDMHLQQVALTQVVDSGLVLPLVDFWATCLAIVATQAMAMEHHIDIPPGVLVEDGVVVVVEDHLGPVDPVLEAQEQEQPQVIYSCLSQRVGGGSTSMQKGVWVIGWRPQNVSFEGLFF